MLMRHQLSRHKNRDIALTSSDTTTIKRVSAELYMDSILFSKFVSWVKGLYIK
jgi:hypothetical protein